MTLPKILLFDLGGVIVPWVGLSALASITGLPRDTVIARFAGSETFRRYERGQTDDAEFIREFKRLFSLTAPNADIPVLWNSWVHAPYPDTARVLAELRPRFTTAALTNTNALHWAHVNQLIDCHASFDHVFASHEIHAAKPDVESYTIPLTAMDTAPEDVWFFDDTMDNIDAARALGMTAFHVDRAVGVIPTLTSLKLISS